MWTSVPFTLSGLISVPTHCPDQIRSLGGQAPSFLVLCVFSPSGSPSPSGMSLQDSRGPFPSPLGLCTCCAPYWGHTSVLLFSPCFFPAFRSSLHIPSSRKPSLTTPHSASSNPLWAPRMPCASHITAASPQVLPRRGGPQTLV